MHADVFGIPSRRTFSSITAQCLSNTYSLFYYKTKSPVIKNLFNIYLHSKQCITHLSVIFLLGANAIEVDQGVETALCVLRGYGGGRHGGGMGMSHHGGSGNFTDMNRTEMLILACTENEFVCIEVSDELLADCTNFTHHHGLGGRDLLMKNFVELAISRGVLMEEKDDLMCKCCMEIVTKHINLVQGSLGHKNGFSSNTRETV
jgi:hypothetical protein